MKKLPIKTPMPPASVPHARPAANPQADRLPPHSAEAERAALGCVLLAGSLSQAETDAILLQLKPRHFYDLRHKRLFEEMIKMKMDGHAVDNVTLHIWLKEHWKNEPELKSYWTSAEIAKLPDAIPTLMNFPTHFKTLELMTKKRWALAEAARLAELANSEDVTDDSLRLGIDKFFDHAERQDQSDDLIFDIITPSEARAYEPDPADNMVGDGLVSRGSFITIGGEPGAGKSRLSITLAVAGARGRATWQNYPVCSQWRSLILQTENQGRRLKEDYDAIPKEYDEWIRLSRTLSDGLAFNNPNFRRKLIQFYDKWPFQMLVVDPWNDVSAEDGQAEYKEALQNIRRCFVGRKMPAVIIVAHLRKPRGDASQRRKTGRELLHELSGSLALGSTSRTVFAVQPASPDMSCKHVVFEVAKANDCHPDWLSKYGTRTAWVRANSAFEWLPEFDWNAWDNPGNDDRRSVEPEMILAAFNGEAELTPAALARKVSGLYDVGDSTVRRAIRPVGYLGYMFEHDDGVLKLKVNGED